MASAMGIDGNKPEMELAAQIRARTFDRAATSAIESYGMELFGFLVNLLGTESDADEVFSQVVEDLWKGLPTFALRSSVRTWLYVLARHAASRYRRSPWQRGERRTGESHLDDAIERTRSRTHPWQRTDVKDRFAALRETLDLDDRTLLVLRVDRDLPWEDVARVMLGDQEATDDALRRESERLRKRFQLLKADLRRRAREAGLLGNSREK